ncbi:hypothetical protein C4D60_Mb01t19650 [Musa balbisiana]|uniref:Uncharacterized protein n=1 Tax=Musa balbisiana TaxID=52838 RepID=A0A4S8JPR7_MUSBA|nr:hypothetical protein C4D60_Mb01t19650 [Musa balbisiana]
MGDSTLGLEESGWEQLRMEARKIEGDSDVKLSSDAKLASRFTNSSSGPSPAIIDASTIACEKLTALSCFVQTSGTMSPRIDGVIGQSTINKISFGIQGILVGDAQGKVNQLGDKFPAIQGLICVQAASCLEILAVIFMYVPSCLEILAVIFMYNSVSNPLYSAGNILQCELKDLAAKILCFLTKWNKLKLKPCRIAFVG